MPRVKCPHCGAGNQDATEQDTCWQCGNVLGAPVTRTPRPAPMNMGTPQDGTRILTGGELPPELRAAPTTGSGPSQRTLALAAVAIVVLVAILLIIIVLIATRQS
ncbi:MAG TPA: hypothetical protein VFB21_17430 [Chthonomonadaceae bacterium]|jgi:hypothetical protein|nr:hypothetical protein [Chthonomonadaceae bacterium]